jgi:carbon monoxide dehydrogenase subunit G
MGTISGSSTAEIEAPIEQVWAVVEDVLGAPDWQGGLKDVQEVERDGDGHVTVTETSSDAKVRTIKSIVRFSYDGPTRLTWSQEKGELKSVDGSWELEDLGDGRTRATYRLEGDPGRVLGMLIRGPVEDRIREILVGGRPGELADRVGG